MSKNVNNTNTTTEDSKNERFGILNYVKLGIGLGLYGIACVVTGTAWRR